MIRMSMEIMSISKIAMSCMFAIFLMNESLFSMNYGFHDRKEYLNNLLMDCIINPEASIANVEKLITAGADPEMDCIMTHVVHGKEEEVKADLHKYGMDESVFSPVESPIQSPREEKKYKLEKQYAGSRDVVDYIFAVILERKVKRMIKLEKEIHGPAVDNEFGTVCLSRYWENWMPKNHK